MTNAPDNYVRWFRHSSPYINAHRDKTFVIMLPGNCIEQANLSNIISDIALLNSLGIRLVVVHGARYQIEEQLAEKNIRSQFHHGLRITSKNDIEQVIAAVGATRLWLEAGFSNGLPNSPMYGAKIRIRSGNFIAAMPQGVIDGVDFQHTGKVRSIDKSGIISLLETGAIALISPLGYSATGEIFNLSFADVAVSVATAIQADKLIAYNDDGQIIDKDGKHYRELTRLQCESFLVDQPLHSRNNTYFSLRACLQACDNGVARAHVISANEDGSLLKELFTRDGAGTMVYRDHYETIRLATIEDVVGILNLIEPLEAAGILVKREREILEREIHFFTVMEKDSIIIGCAAVYPYSENNAGELACVAIHPEHRRDGRAAKLLKHIERYAASIRLTRLFVLTTQTAHWFIEQGFSACAIEDLPMERRKLYNYQRQSKVFSKTLTG
ncbi:MAG: amino-acid N-acetyltransferase [Pseudomonadota bacterium]|jgi:amino-acid N-acetyltransferase